MDDDGRLRHTKWKLQIAATVAYRAAAVRHLVRHSQSGGRPDWSDTDKPLRAAPKLKPPALPGDTYYVRRLHRLRLRHWGEFAICPRLLPEPERDRNRIDVESAPPCSLITRTMQLAMVGPADRNDELVAHS